MPINITTIYTKERLFQFHRFVWASKKLFWIILAVCTIIILGNCLFLLWLDADFTDILFFLFFVIFVDATYLFCAFILPRFTLKKAKNLNTTVNYSFDTDCFHIQSTNAYVAEALTIQYSLLTKVEKKQSELYLLVSRHQAFIVDLSNISPEQEANLKDILSANIPQKKLKWPPSFPSEC